MENLPEGGAEKITEMNKLQFLPEIMYTPEDLIEWMLSFLSSSEISVEEWMKIYHSEVHILIPAEG
ncbi:hypothetical protein AAEO50_02995 [Rossellomorea oryzaecorticis]|uniref:Uncharacterized protein n=1 Tax=Rossellomorea oryzaecorticis TaxID=1396505 RepID=A0ABU9K575_9BACI